MLSTPEMYYRIGRAHGINGWYCTDVDKTLTPCPWTTPMDYLVNGLPKNGLPLKILEIKEAAIITLFIFVLHRCLFE